MLLFIGISLSSLSLQAGRCRERWLLQLAPKTSCRSHKGSVDSET